MQHLPTFKMKFLFITAGILFVGLAVLGIIVPGLPATPFLLLASAAFIKSSPRLYHWLNNHRIFGSLLKDFAEKKGISLRNKLISIILMIAMTSISIIFFIQSDPVKIIVAICALAGTTVVLSLKTVKKK